jgi:hypothetical protein
MTAQFDVVACRVPEFHPWLASALSGIFIAQAHYIMAFLSFTQEKWSLAVKLYIGASDSLSAAGETINAAEADGMAVTQAFKCALTQLYLTTYTHKHAVLEVRCHGTAPPLE